MRRFANHRGQFIPLATLVILSISIFVVGVVNVYRVSRAKLKAQNLADAAAMFVAGTSTQSFNMIADRNEWGNHLYYDPNDPSKSVAGSDPCWVPPGRQTSAPPGWGCFARTTNPNPNRFHFTSENTARSYARLYQTINQIQSLFESSYNTLLDANSQVQSSNGQSSLQANLFRAIPAFVSDPGISVWVYNSQQGKNWAQQQANTYEQNQNNANQSANNRTIATHFERQMTAVKFKSIPITVPYCGGTLLGGCGEMKTKTLGELAGGQPGDIGFRVPDTSTMPMMDTTRSLTGAGAIVSIRVDLIGLGAKYVRATSVAYRIKVGQNSDGSEKNFLDGQTGTANAAYWIRLGKP